MNKPLILIYQDDSNDPHTRSFDNKEKLIEWVNKYIPCNKHGKISGDIKEIDVTMAS